MQTFCSFNHVQIGKTSKGWKGRREKRCHLSSGALKQCQGRRYIKKWHWKQINFLYPWPAWHKWINTQTVQTKVPWNAKCILTNFGCVLTSRFCRNICPTWKKIDSTTPTSETSKIKSVTSGRYRQLLQQCRSIYKAVADWFLQRGHVHLIFGLSPRLKLHIRSEENQAL